MGSSAWHVLDGNLERPFVHWRDPDHALEGGPRFTAGAKEDDNEDARAGHRDSRTSYHMNPGPGGEVPARCQNMQWKNLPRCNMDPRDAPTPNSKRQCFKRMGAGRGF